ncbi:MAG: ASKHA domain-containing protein [bacterium]
MVLRLCVKRGLTVLEAARIAGFPIGTECGGFGKCTRCRTIPFSPVEEKTPAHSPPSWLELPNAAERLQLAPEELDAGWRLACQLKVQGDISVLVPLPDDNVRHKSIDTSIPVHLDPWTERVSFSLDTPGEGEAGAAVGKALGKLNRDGRLKVRPRVEEEIASLLEELPWRKMGNRPSLTLTITDGAVVHVEVGDTSRCAYGAVIDIGTTNLFGYLIDLATGALLAEASRPNSQRQWGSDLMSRVHAASPKAQGGNGAREELTSAVRRDVNLVLTDLLRQAKARRSHLTGLIFVGNSVMHHLFLGFPVESFGTAPYLSLVDEGIAFRPKEKGLRLPSSAMAHFLPLLGGFVGADAVGVALALGLGRPDREKPLLALDLGTNVEMLLASPDGALWYTSAPAGPAFEGGEIRCGMPSVAGAIYEAEFEEGRLRICTFEGLPAAGICGTGLIDVTAGLLDMGVLEPSGRIRSAAELPRNAHDSLRKRIVEEETRRGFILEEAQNTASGLPIVLDQWDVRKLQAAKAAVRAGASLLLEEAGIGWEDLEAIILAGAFGAHLRPERAVRIGLLPPCPLERIRIVNNAAGSGARLALLSRTERNRAAELKKKARYVKLAGRREFQDAYIDALPFPG